MTIQAKPNCLNLISSNSLIQDGLDPTSFDFFKQYSFLILKVPQTFVDHFSELSTSLQDISQSQRDAFSFVGNTDGFMPLGITNARNTDDVDLCQTFNYWYAYRKLHAQYDISLTRFYQLVTECETFLNQQALSVLSEVAKHYNYTYPFNIRHDSFLQYNQYLNELKQKHRRYLQAKHEDGHLITIVKPNAPGLVVYLNDEEWLVNLDSNEIIVMADSLLTELTAGEIKPLYHSVMDLNLPAPRASLIYNSNLLSNNVPDIHGKIIPMGDIATQHHTEFGQKPYHSDAHLLEQIIN